MTTSATTIRTCPNTTNPIEDENVPKSDYRKAFKGTLHAHPVTIQAWLQAQQEEEKEHTASGQQHTSPGDMHTSLEEPHTPWGQQQKAEQKIEGIKEKIKEGEEEQEIQWLLVVAVHSHVPLEDYVAVSTSLALSLF
jgi:hypothetical protein